MLSTNSGIHLILNSVSITTNSLTSTIPIVLYKIHRNSDVRVTFHLSNLEHISISSFTNNMDHYVPSHGRNHSHGTNHSLDSNKTDSHHNLQSNNPNNLTNTVVTKSTNINTNDSNKCSKAQLLQQISNSNKFSKE